MTASDDLERRIADHFVAEVPGRAPDRVLRRALATIDTTRQRRVLVPAPWRFPTMHGLTRVAAVAVAVIALGAFGLAVLRPGSSPVGGSAPSASPTISPTAAPTPSATPDPSLPPPLGATFTSTMHGISLSYPTGWAVTSATALWTPASGLSFGSPNQDTLYDPVLKDHLFLALASQPVKGLGSTWVARLMSNPETGCGTSTTEAITVDGATGRFCPNSNVVAVTTGDRGYAITLYLSGDEPWLAGSYDEAWYRSLLGTVHLHPADARASAAPSTPAAPSAKPS
jgi:hypothetical protein